jgi:hypothetical protein
MATTHLGGGGGALERCRDIALVSMSLLRTVMEGIRRWFDG